MTEQSWPEQDQFDQAENHGIEWALQELANGAVEAQESPLSGEWAGGLVPADVAFNVGYTPSGKKAHQAVGELADAWERGYHSQWAINEQMRADAKSVTDVFNANKERT